MAFVRPRLQGSIVVAGDDRDLLAMTLATIDAVDAVISAFWGRVSVILRMMPSPLTHRARRDAMRQIETEIGSVFGPTQRAAARAQLYRTIDGYLIKTANMPPYRMVSHLRAMVDTRNHDLWITILRQATPDSPDPFLRAVSMSSPGMRPLTPPPYPDPIAKERILRSKSLDTNRRWVNAKTDGGTGDSYRLSDRVWRLGKETRTAIDDRIKLGISRGEDALSIADDLVQYLRTNQQPEIITKDGKVIRSKNMTKTPGRGGWGSHQARRLARTEVTRVHGAATIETVRVTPGTIGVRWRLSGSHPKIDDCDRYADADDHGLGRGVYPVDQVPPYPSHPHELCTLVPVMKSREEVLADLIRRYAS